MQEFIHASFVWRTEHSWSFLAKVELYKYSYARSELLKRKRMIKAFTYYIVSEVFVSRFCWREPEIYQISELHLDFDSNLIDCQHGRTSFYWRRAWKAKCIFRCSYYLDACTLCLASVTKINVFAFKRRSMYSYLSKIQSTYQGSFQCYLSA